ncbi:S-adenosyl-L-methionine-dependent methyltransferase [Hypoxylon trugodes]|uniref:S-adenosyl-L-methionine-dependent methyltransferase n=1 Tax=Hypoxylon trugodes TaxID=326681 RepID=UPI00219260EF|nr:S-adenosyl-L-methionine-dependent methyltransferase [Hypoxylon trugodes]KAI1391008.1 S-adenosyl-L-methionine-dependent methyltransferase [Hypoxylon trugodes]
MSTSRIIELSTNIAANSAKIHDYLVTHGLPTLSFDINAPSSSIIPKDAVDIESARVSIIDDTLELRRLALGPREHLMSYTHNELISQQAITRFGLAHAFPIGSEATFADIAKASNLNEQIVRQILRHAIMNNIFAEPRPGIIRHNAVSRLLAEDQVVHDWVGANTDDMWQAAAQTCNALASFPGSQEPNETGFALANQTIKSMYEFLSEHPERARRFGNAMRCFTEGPGFELSHITDNFPWGDLGNGTVIDVGGSRGFVCLELARKFPLLSCVVQDLEPVIAASQNDVPSDLANRVRFMNYDFLSGNQPCRGAEVYFFRWIFHNWSDKYCIKILQNLIPALKHGAKIIVNDNVLPEPGILPQRQETRLRSMDLCMTEIQNSHDRELTDWVALFKAADPRFEFQQSVHPSGSNLWILVVEWKGD